MMFLYRLTWALIILGGWLVIGFVVGLALGQLFRDGRSRDEQIQAAPVYRRPITWTSRSLAPRNRHQAGVRLGGRLGADGARRGQASSRVAQSTGSEPPCHGLMS